jgi:hypothetical protein
MWFQLLLNPHRIRQMINANTPSLLVVICVDQDFFSEVIASVIPTAMDSNTADSELAHSFSPAGGAGAPLPLRTLAI